MATGGKEEQMIIKLQSVLLKTDAPVRTFPPMEHTEHFHVAKGGLEITYDTESNLICFTKGTRKRWAHASNAKELDMLEEEPKRADKPTRKPFTANDEVA